MIPCRNEESYIGSLVENLLAQDFPQNQLEVFFIDGMSTDKTQDILMNYIQEYPFLHFLENQQKFVPFGLNKAIKIAKGDVIVRMDAHSIYPTNYLSELVFQLDELNAQNVGGAWNILPANTSAMAEAIAYSNSHPFGIGNAEYRYAEKNIRPVDTVPFGCYPRKIFDEIGFFDEDLIRNQDDEFNARLKKNGGKIFLIPSIRIDYFARPNFGKMFKMFYQYGLYKPLVNKKLGKISTLRQLFPALLILGTLTGIISTLFWNFLLPFLIAPWVIYLLTTSIISFQHFLRKKKWKSSVLLPISFFLIHVAYGLGYIKGLFLIGIGKKPKTPSQSR